jgi:AcrR family transcriptional regulator
MNTTKKTLKRELILKAASIIVQEEGVEKLTLEAVAKKAGVREDCFTIFRIKMN